ncbi:MAG: hypothetical protein ACREEM_43560 [Blastocatellia bacterium]
MRKRPTDREKLLSQLNRLTDNEVRDVLNYISKLNSNSRDLPQSDGAEDDLVIMLSGAYENRRARQVFEWESARRRAEARASSQRAAGR